MSLDQSEECEHCGRPCYLDGGCHKHHLFKRSTHPHLKHDKRNLITLCPLCHNLTENDNSFLWWLADKHGRARGLLGDREADGGRGHDTA